MLMETSSIVWLSIVGVIVLGGIIGIVATKSKPPSNFAKIMSYTLVVGFQAALNNTLSKLMSCTDGNLWYGVTGGFVAGSVISGGFSAMACTATDSSVSVPLMSCVQVLVNGMSGIFIWGDLPRISTPISYTFVYLYFFLGIYLTSTADLGSTITRWASFHKEKNILREPCKGQRGGLMQDLYSAVKKGVDGTTEQGELIKTFESYLANANKDHIITHEFDTLASETMKAASKHGGDKEVAGALSRWLVNHSANFEYLMSHDPEFAADVQAVVAKAGGSDLSTPLLN
jgi:hypothetical protein